ncbi:pentatricopeptide repeat-containing protein [Forsythia ovata]|uniref:Pentatricopeptide repeat-containing protein n=1 Tax=Forsythia ovata TaxID=205694 RepID=A0ABD1RN13_9LAMI
MEGAFLSNKPAFPIHPAKPTAQSNHQNLKFNTSTLPLPTILPQQQSPSPHSFHLDSLIQHLLHISIPVKSSFTYSSQNQDSLPPQFKKSNESLDFLPLKYSEKLKKDSETVNDYDDLDIGTNPSEEPPPLPPDEPPKTSVLPPSHLELGQPFTYTEQYNLSYDIISNVFGAAPFVVNPVEPAAYLGLQNRTVNSASLVSDTAMESSLTSLVFDGKRFAKCESQKSAPPDIQRCPCFTVDASQSSKSLPKLPVKAISMVWAHR